MNEIISIESEITRLNKRIKELRERKKIAEHNLYEFMLSKNLDNFTHDGRKIFIEKITPKIKKKALPKKQRDELTKRYLREQGVRDPDEIFQEIERLKAAEPMRLLRVERDRLIAETDWWVLPDRTPTSEQLAYRQALRDLPDTSSPVLDPTSRIGISGVSWPVKP